MRALTPGYMNYGATRPPSGCGPVATVASDVWENRVGPEVCVDNPVGADHICSDTFVAYGRVGQRKNDVHLADDQAKPCLSMALPGVRPAPKRLCWSQQQTLKRVEL